MVIAGILEYLILIQYNFWEKITLGWVFECLTGVMVMVEVEPCIQWIKTTYLQVQSGLLLLLPHCSRAEQPSPVRFSQQTGGSQETPSPPPQLPGSTSASASYLLQILNIMTNILFHFIFIILFYSLYFFFFTKMPNAIQFSKSQNYH